MSSGVPVAITVTDHDPDLQVSVNRTAFRNALAILVAACILSATEATALSIDCHCKDGVPCVQIAFVSAGKVPARFKFPQAAKRVLAENGFKTTILRGSLDRLTVILRQADEE